MSMCDKARNTDCKHLGLPVPVAGYTHLPLPVPTLYTAVDCWSCFLYFRQIHDCPFLLEQTHASGTLLVKRKEV